MAKQKKKKAGIYEFTRIALGQQTYGKRQFKRDLRKLQKSGILSAKIDINIQEPTRYMLSQIRKWKSVLQGEAKTIPVSRAEKDFYKNAGYPVKSGHAVIQVSKGERVRKGKTKNGIPSHIVTSKGVNGRMVSQNILVPYPDLERYITTTVEAMPPLKKGEYYAFKFYGYNSHQYFRDDDPDSYNPRTAKEKLILNVLKYDAVKYDDEHQVRQDDPDSVYQNFEVVKITRPQVWNDEGVAIRKARRSEYRKANRARRNEWYEKRLTEMTPAEREYTLKTERRDDAARKREARAKMRQTDGDATMAYREAAKARAAKSRANRRGKK
jgi:hypothetical protein